MPIANENYVYETFGPHIDRTFLEMDLSCLMGDQESLAESTSITSNEITHSKLPYKCEVKQCHYTYNNGEPKKSATPTPQLILHKDGKNWRVRAEMMLFKDDKLYLVKQNKVNQYGVTYKLPGGGIDSVKEGIEDTAARECKEEARIIPTNVVYTGVEVQHEYGEDNIPKWHKAILHPEGIYYDGSMTFICTGNYKQEFKSYVKKMDQQDEMTKGRFYTYEQVEGILSKEHKSLFKKYLKDYRRLQFMKEESIPEIDRSFLDMDISCLMEEDLSINENAPLNEMAVHKGYWTYRRKRICCLDDFIKICSHPLDTMSVFAKHKVGFASANNLLADFRLTHPYFLWPDDIIINNIGNCIEYSFMMYRYFKSKQIKHWIMAAAIFTFNKVDVSEGDVRSAVVRKPELHVYPMFEMQGTIYLWNYKNDADRYNIIVPVGNSIVAAKSYVEQYYSIIAMSRNNKYKSSKPNYSFTFSVSYNDYDYRVIDGCFEKGESITQDELDKKMSVRARLQDECNRREYLIKSSNQKLSIPDRMEFLYDNIPVDVYDKVTKEYFKS